jgi:hypothetical protein
MSASISRSERALCQLGSSRRQTEIFAEGRQDAAILHPSSSGEADVVSLTWR